MAEDEGIADVSPRGGGGKSKWIVILILLLLAGLAIWYFLFNTSEEDPKKGAVLEEVGPPLTPLFLDVGPFVVNLERGNNFLNINIKLMIIDPLVFEYLNTRLFEVKDITLLELQKLSTEEIHDPEDIQKLKQHLIERISQLFPNEPPWETKNPIYKVLFIDFLVQ
ncbi:flagellar basal body-associated FliL family protein [Deltaproteobacteria bacterium TL4]